MSKSVSIEQIRNALEKFIASKLGARDVRILDVYVSEDSSGDEVFIIELLFRQTPAPGVGNDLTYALRKELFEIGEERFPIFYSKFSEDGATAF